MTCVFEKASSKKNGTLPIKKELKKFIEGSLTGASYDKRFVYYLLASTGICVVPLSSGFNSHLQGFRFTVLEPDMKRFKKMIDTLAEAIKKFSSEI